jgi:hypothetical protein
VPTELAIRRVRPTPAAELARVLQIPLPAAPLGLDGGPSASELVLTGSGGVPQPETEAAVLTWTSSQHLVVLRLSRELLRPTRPPTEGRPIRVGALGRGRLQPVFNGLRVQLLGPRGLLMTVTADLSERDLLSWIGGLSLG